MIVFSPTVLYEMLKLYEKEQEDCSKTQDKCSNIELSKPFEKEIKENEDE